MINTLDGYAIAVGMHSFYGAGGSSAMVVKIGDDASFPPFLASPLVENLVSVNENYLDGTIAVYPNPFQEKLTITIQQATNLTVFSALGELVTSYSLQGNLVIDTTTWLTGVYLLQFTTENGSSVVKVVK
jgi:hypothetical protein